MTQEKTTVPTSDQNVENTTAKKPFDKGNKIPNKYDDPKRFPEHIVNIVLIIKNNAEIRRFTSLGILNYLLQKGEIKGEHRWVAFKWNKFIVSANGLKREYTYNEPFFLNALVASFASFASSAQITINKYLKKELNVKFEDAVDTEIVQNIINDNEAHAEDLAKLAETENE